MNIIKRVQEKLQAETPSWVHVHVTDDEKVGVNIKNGVLVAVLDLHKLVKETDTDVDDKMLEAYDKVVSQSSVLLPMIKMLYSSFVSTKK